MRAWRFDGISEPGPERFALPLRLLGTLKFKPLHFSRAMALGSPSAGAQSLIRTAAAFSANGMITPAVVLTRGTPLRILSSVMVLSRRALIRLGIHASRLVKSTMALFDLHPPSGRSNEFPLLCRLMRKDRYIRRVKK